MNGIRNKTILISISFITILVLAGIAWGILNSPSTNSSENKIATNKNANSNTIPTNSLPTYRGDTYTVSYPTGWMTKKTTLDNDEGTIVTFSPEQVNAGQFERMSVETLNSQITTIGTLTQMFTILQYTQTNTTVAGINAMKYTAILPEQNSKLHSTAYVLQKNGKIYVLKLEYDQEETNTSLEDQFNQFIASFSVE